MAVTTKIIVQQILNIDDTKATASKFPRYTVTLGNSISSITASELVSSIEAAAKSAAAAKDSEIAAKTSELNAKNSEQEAAISAGASEASATQSATSATQSAASADRSAASAAAAKVSETNAKASETKAKTSETNAKASETNAKSSETKAKASETNARTSESKAAESAAAAKISETNAKASETNAAASAADSSDFRNEAETFSTQAATSASAAKTSETKAKTSETNAKASETKAKASETNAASSATSASQSVTTIQGLKSDVEQLKSDTQAIKNSAVTETTAIKADVAQLKSDTQAIKNSAVTETTALKNQAATSATNAAASATEAGKQATNAANSANNAKTEADRSKTEADRAKTEADRSEAAINNTPEIHPLPDVWIPFNDSLDMITGFAPGYKQITVGDDVVNMVSDKVVDFKRASGATYINKSGVLTVAEVDEPRFEREGLLIEGQRTNLLINSTDPTKWNKSPNMILRTSGVDNFGFNYGKFTLKEEAVGQTSGLNIVTVSGGRGFDVTGNEKYVTISCRVQSGTPNLRCRLRFEHYDGSAYTFLGDARVNLTDLSIEKSGGAANRITARAVKDEASKWIFFEATIKALDTENMIGAMVQYAPPKGAGTGANDYIYVSTPQVEGGSCASSFIITEATPATRASDLVTIPIKNNLYNAPVSCLVEVNKNWDVAPNLAPRIFDISGFKTADDVLVFGFRSAIGNGRPYVQFGSIVSFPAVDSERKLIAGFVRNTERNFKVVSNGIFSTQTKSSWSSVNGAHTIRIGYNLANGERSLFGHIRNFRIWHKALTDRQMKESI